jgi:TRAP transporter TAXI family solute receptor
MEEVQITLGTSSVGGSYYMYGGGVSSYINNNVDGIVITAQTTKGSNENTRLLGDRIDMAFANGQAVWFSRTSEGLVDSRAVLTVDIAPSHWVTLEGSGIDKIEDVVGHKMSIGAPGSGAERSAMNVLIGYGIWEKVEPDAVRLGFSESTTALKDGHIKAAAMGSALPMPAISELATLRKIKLLSIADWAFENIVKANPPYIRVTIPAGTYQGVDYPVATYGVPSTLIVHKDVPEDAVYQIVKTLFTEEAIKYMKNVYFAWSPIPNQEFFEQIGIPFHPGAEKYYREAGTIK